MSNRFAMLSAIAALAAGVVIGARSAAFVDRWHDVDDHDVDDDDDDVQSSKINDGPVQHWSDWACDTRPDDVRLCGSFD